MERRANYPLGAVSTAAYCVLFWQFGLVASSAINGFLMVYLLYGWFRWKSDDVTRPVTRMTIPSWALSVLVAGIGYLIVVFIAGLLGGTLLWSDSLILALTILAQFMLDNKKYENWYVWAVMNVIAIFVYFHVGLFLAAFQYLFFLANAFYGLYMWNKSRKATLPPNLAGTVGNALTSKGVEFVEDHPEYEVKVTA
jgi:nicotinamide mononucleotide transporter